MTNTMTVNGYVIVRCGVDVMWNEKKNQKREKGIQTDLICA